MPTWFSMCAFCRIRISFRGCSKYSGSDPKVARYIRSFPQTGEFLRRIEGLLAYLIPHYIREGKSYLTIAFGCTGGRHRSVMMAEAVRTMLARTGLSDKSGAPRPGRNNFALSAARKSPHRLDVHGIRFSTGGACSTRLTSNKCLHSVGFLFNEMILFPGFSQRAH